MWTLYNLTINKNDYMCCLIFICYHIPILQFISTKHKSDPSIHFLCCLSLLLLIPSIIMAIIYRFENQGGKKIKGLIIFLLKFCGNHSLNVNIYLYKIGQTYYCYGGIYIQTYIYTYIYIYIQIFIYLCIHIFCSILVTILKMH